MQTQQSVNKKVTGDEALEAAADQWFQLLLETFQHDQPVNNPIKKEVPCHIKVVVNLTPPNGKYLLARVKVILYESLIIDGWTISKSIKIDERFQASIWIQSPRVKLGNNFWLTIVSITDKEVRDLIEEKIYDTYHRLINDKNERLKYIENLTNPTSIDK
jgi:hypothetical protein